MGVRGVIILVDEAAILYRSLDKEPGLFRDESSRNCVCGTISDLSPPRGVNGATGSPPLGLFGTGICDRRADFDVAGVSAPGDCDRRLGLMLDATEVDRMGDLEEDALGVVARGGPPTERRMGVFGLL